MAAQFDLVVRNGTVLDGTGGEPREADVAVQDGRIAAVGAVAGAGREEIDAKGLAVTPGFVDIHTHYDGQATWDAALHAVVGPRRDHGADGQLRRRLRALPAAGPRHLIKVMEGVEDIPEIVHAAKACRGTGRASPNISTRWPQRRCDIDFATQVPHAPLRVFVMGQRGVDREPATAQDMAAMAALVEEGLEAGALGFSTSRSLFHRTPDGVLTPTITAAEEELTAIARGMRRAGKGVIQLLDDFADATDEGSTEFAMLRRLVEASGRPLSFTLLDISIYPGRWKTLLREVERANRDGLPIRGQVAGRPVGAAVRARTVVQSVLDLPELCRGRRSAAGAEAREAARSGDAGEAAGRGADLPQSADARLHAQRRQHVSCWAIRRTTRRRRPAAGCAGGDALGVTPLELAYDLLVSGDGRTILFHPGANYTDCSDANMASMLHHDYTVMALGDGGAHYGMICDASYTTHALTYWTRDRPGERWSLPWAVQQLTDVPARTVGLRRSRPAGARLQGRPQRDRSRQAAGRRAASGAQPARRRPAAGAEGRGLSRDRRRRRRSPIATANSPARCRAGSVEAQSFLPAHSVGEVAR